ncbi:hypothetical protein SK128_028670 [Halocaridina rubra]|uniref:Uncharacterized protein n=1 Tax=Halocaridina rubra TaxID=373956 RepID=A0AAN9ACW0_HALRR
MGDEVWVKPPDGKCTSQKRRGIVTAMHSQNNISVNGMLLHIMDLWWVVDNEESEVEEDGEFEYYRLLGDRILLLKGYMKVKYSKRRIRNRHRFSQIFLELDQLQLKDGAYALPDPDYPDEEDLEDINGK